MYHLFSTNYKQKWKWKVAGVTKGNKKIKLFLTATTEPILIFFSYTPEFP